MTAYASVPTAIEAMREGAFDYVTKPFEPEHLRAVVLTALQRFVPRGEERSADAGTKPSGFQDQPAGATTPALPELRPTLVDMKWQQAVDLYRRDGGRRYLSAVLERYGGRVADAAAHAGVERESFYRLLRRHGIQTQGKDGSDR